MEFQDVCGKENLLLQLQNPQGLENPNSPSIYCSEPKLAHSVVLKMIEDFTNLNHIIVRNHVFFKHRIFHGPFIYEIHVTGIVRPNWVELPNDLKDTKSFKNLKQ